MSRFLVPLAVPLALLTTLSACSSGTSTVVEAVPLAAIPPAAGIQLAGARHALVEFLDAYANAGTDGGKELEQVVAGGPPELRDWVRWLIVQDRSNPGDLTGSARISGIRFENFVSILGRFLGATFALDAHVTLTYRPPSGSPVTINHDFTGDATVFQRGPGDWGVYDVTRDSQSMDSQIHLLSGLSVSSGGIDMHIESLWTLTPFLSFNVTVANHEAGAIGLDADRTALVGNSQSDTTHPQSHTSGLDSIPGGGTAQGTVNFGTPSPQTTALVVSFDRSKGPPVELKVSLNRLVNSVPPTGAAPSPAPVG
jgi:hypothetical protein